MAVITYPIFNGVLVYNDSILQILYGCSIQPAIALSLISCCAKLPYPEIKAKGCKEFPPKSSPVSVNTHKGIPNVMTQMFWKIVAICVKLILAVVVA